MKRALTPSSSVSPSCETEPGDFRVWQRCCRVRIDAPKSTVEGEPAARAAWSDGLLMAQLCPLMRRQLDADEPVSIGLFVTHSGPSFTGLVELSGRIRQVRCPFGTRRSERVTAGKSHQTKARGGSACHFKSPQSGIGSNPRGLAAMAVAIVRKVDPSVHRSAGHRSDRALREGG
jgi:hypothetical protein